LWLLLARSFFSGWIASCSFCCCTMPHALALACVLRTAH
jgi:hypothetical protein